MDRPEKISKFIQVILKEARRNSLFDLCENSGINETEMYDGLDYIEEVLSVRDL